MVLRDENGAEVPAKNTLSSLQAYPENYDIFQMASDRASRGEIQIGHSFVPEFLLDRMPLLASFNLDSQFIMKKPGKYSLTIWPKIYKHVLTNEFFHERIDLPQFTVPVEWNNEAHK